MDNKLHDYIVKDFPMMVTGVSVGVSHLFLNWSKTYVDLLGAKVGKAQEMGLLRTDTFREEIKELLEIPIRKQLLNLSDNIKLFENYIENCSSITQKNEIDDYSKHDTGVNVEMDYYMYRNPIKHRVICGVVPAPNMVSRVHELLNNERMRYNTIDNFSTPVISYSYPTIRDLSFNSNIDYQEINAETIIDIDTLFMIMMCKYFPFLRLIDTFTEVEPDKWLERFNTIINEINSNELEKFVENKIKGAIYVTLVSSYKLFYDNVSLGFYESLIEDLLKTNKSVELLESVNVDETRKLRRHLMSRNMALFGPLVGQVSKALLSDNTKDLWSNYGWYNENSDRNTFTRGVYTEMIEQMVKLKTSVINSFDFIEDTMKANVKSFTLHSSLDKIEKEASLPKVITSEDEERAIYIHAYFDHETDLSYETREMFLDDVYLFYRSRDNFLKFIKTVFKEFIVLQNMRQYFISDSMLAETDEGIREDNLMLRYRDAFQDLAQMISRMVERYSMSDFLNGRYSFDAYQRVLIKEISRFNNRTHIDKYKFTISPVIAKEYNNTGELYRKLSIILRSGRQMVGHKLFDIPFADYLDVFVAESTTKLGQDDRDSYYMYERLFSKLMSENGIYAMESYCEEMNGRMFNSKEEVISLIDNINDDLLISHESEHYPSVIDDFKDFVALENSLVGTKFLEDDTITEKIEKLRSNVDTVLADYYSK